MISGNKRLKSIVFPQLNAVFLLSARCVAKCSVYNTRFHVHLSVCNCFMTRLPWNNAQCVSAREFIVQDEHEVHRSPHLATHFAYEVALRSHTRGMVMTMQVYHLGLGL